VTGPDLDTLARALEQTDGVDAVAAFGNTLHVSGRDAERLARAIASLRDGGPQQWQRGTPSLEDVFIDLMGRPRAALAA
jgi:ABC-2 type transport system ATP-binding protein